MKHTKTFISTYLNNDFIPEDSIIYNTLDEIGFNGFIPKNFIADLLIISKYKLLKLKMPDLNNEYINSIYEIINSLDITNWVYDTLYFLKRISNKYNLRTIEAYANAGNKVKLTDIDFSYNYVFDLTNVNEHMQKLFNISDAQMQEIEKLPEDIVDVLTIANSVGSFLKTSKTIVSSNKQMTTYGDIVKIHKHMFADPLFKYKFSIKAYDLDIDTITTHKSNKIIIGYFFGNYKRQGITEILIKLLGAIVLNNYTEGIEIIVYSFFMDTYQKEELHTIDEIIRYFSSPKQLKLFLIDNSKSLETMITENLGNDIVFIPNILGSCHLKDNLSGTNRVNIISVKESDYNLQYANVCKKTKGTFLII